MREHGQAEDSQKKQWLLINEIGEADSVSPQRMDELWALGWRHFGPRFFRYSVMWQDGLCKRVINLRVSLKDWTPSRSQRRTLKQNTDLQVDIGPANPGLEEQELFQRHKLRFTANIPEALDDFLGAEPNGVPVPCLQVSVRDRDGGRLLATSFLDIGATSCSSIYGVFEPEEFKRRLGILTMLLEMQYAKENGMKFYYLGYACVESSPYDYKKEIKPLALWDWERWQEFKPDDYSKQAPPIPEELRE